MQGGPRKGAGRKKGSPNKVTAEIRSIARVHGPDAIAQLVRLMTKSKSEMARIAAAKELLDRGYGKSTQPLSGDPDNPSVFPDKVEIVVVEPTVDKPPNETRDEWLARRKRELEAGNPRNLGLGGRH
jgi:hypothetical protein